MKDSSMSVPIADAIASMDEKRQKTLEEIKEQINNIQDENVKGVLLKTILFILQTTNNNMLRFYWNVYKIETLEKADKDIQEQVKPILEKIVENEKHPFAI